MFSSNKNDLAYQEDRYGVSYHETGFLNIRNRSMERVTSIVKKAKHMWA